LEALIADLERKLEDLTVENQELTDAKAIYETERTRLMEAFDQQRAQLVANDEKIATLEAALATATGGAIAPTSEPGAVV
jgi:Tfp pilus assembly ATPase PilU